ncbi:M16 family metallopeptidase [Flavobacterium caeni]|uniref:Predicted Zn-dependent peptidase n=1 Tax=Flavobacterium caeni TaxID=490189 RepID=A0A1G5IKJ6_9FLAO|nr:pitrilysin family protein [Flavobacterium caeni]SCY76635.1 Predicted Zn-dependent peptidase [Flavobacterium caeni]
MKKTLILLLGLSFTVIMQAQNRLQPKPGPSPSIKINKPQTFTLPNGLKVLVVENHKLPRVSFNLFIDNAPYAEGNKKGVSSLTGRLLGNGSTNIPKDAFNEEVDFLGAEIDFSSSGARASSLSKYADRILEMLADAALHPNFTQEEFDKEKAKLLEGLKNDEKSVPATARRVEDVLAYGKNHPFGEYLSEQTIGNVQLDDVKANYQEYFVPNNAYLVVIGDVETGAVKAKIEDLFASWTNAAAPNFTYPDPKNVQYLQINFVDMPNAVQSEIALVNTVNLKMDHPDFFPAIVANQILGGDFNGYLNMNLREAHGWTYGAHSSMGFGKYVEKFVATSSVRNAVTDSAVVELVNEIKRIRSEKVSEENLKNIKAGYIGRFVMQIEKPQTIARYALNIETQKLPVDFYENYIKNINAVTADDVLRVANKYFLVDNMRIIVTGKGSEVLPALEKLKIPILYFDKYGNPTQKIVAKQPVPAGTTAQTVIGNYLKAIGGEKVLGGIKSVVTVSSGTVQGMPVELTSKTTKGKSMREVKAMGMSMMKQVVNDKGAYSVVQGQRKEITGDDWTEMKQEALPFVELGLAKKTGLVLDGIEPINDTDAYVIKDGTSAYYFDTKTGLKVAESKEVTIEGQKTTQTVLLGDYREVKGVKIPHHTKLNLGIEVELTTTDVTFNEKVSDTDFQ